MPDNTAFNVVIKSTKPGEEAVPAVIFADYIKAVQAIAYTAGDYLLKNPCRSGGDVPKKVKDNCTLVFRDLKLGSIDATLAVQSQNHTLFDMGPVCMQACDIIQKSFRVANEADDISTTLFETIPDEFRNDRILKEIEKIWPDETAGYSIEMQYPKSESIKLSPKRKPMIQQANRKKPQKYSAEIYGRMVDVRVDDKPKFELSTTIGVVGGFYENVHADVIPSLLGKFVQISGVITETGQKKDITIGPTPDAIKPVDAIPLTKIISGTKDPIDLAEPLTIDVLWDGEEKEFILSNKEYRLLGVGDTLQGAMQEIEHGVLFLCSEYLREDDENLTKDARKLKSRLQTLFCCGEE